MLANPDMGEQLLLGGDNGLRGYPLRYQSGNKSLLFNVERRAYPIGTHSACSALAVQSSTISAAPGAMA